MTVTVRIVEDGGRLVLRVAGPLDRAGAPVLTAHLDAVWALSEGPDLVIDAGGVTYCGPAGVSAFAALRARLDDRGGRVVLVGVAGQLERALESGGLLHRFDRSPHDILGGGG
ncbi:MAG: STAS domain-containing protein [Nonomuraea sp.]|nr:STAS domain-containing protein [Nonomuraea sp.]